MAESPDWTWDSVTETTDCDRLTAPGIIVVVGNAEVTEMPSMVAVNTAFEAIEAVKVAV